MPFLQTSYAIASGNTNKADLSGKVLFSKLPD